MLEQALDLENALYQPQENAPRDRVDKIPRRTARLFFVAIYLAKTGIKRSGDFLVSRPILTARIEGLPRSMALRAALAMRKREKPSPERVNAGFSVRKIALIST